MPYYSLTSLKQQAKNTMKTTKPSVFIATILFFIIIMVLSNLTVRLTGYDRLYNEMYQHLISGETIDYFEFIYQHMPRITAFAGLLVFIISLMMSMLNAGYMGYCLKVSRSEQTRFMDIFRSFDHFGKALGIVILMFIYVFLWSLLLVIPGIIAAFRYSQAFFIMYDHPEYSAARCLQESSQMMRGWKWKLFILELSFIGWRILNGLIAAFLGIGFLDIFIRPFVGITEANFYNFISGGVRNEAPPVWENY